jgi:pyruvate formate lyase activating enzyme
VPGLNDSDADLAALRDFTRGLRNMEKLEICPYHPLGLEKCAKFGLSPRYAGMSQPTAADLARYKSFLRPARNEMDSAVERDN